MEFLPVEESACYRCGNPESGKLNPSGLASGPRRILVLMASQRVLGTDLSIHDQHHLDEVARQLNDRPRQTLGWIKPSEALAKVVALTG